jgi:hypothetical protein
VRRPGPLPHANGGQKALEVLVFPEAMRGVAEGHYGWDLHPSSVMTNGNVEQTVWITVGVRKRRTWPGVHERGINPSGDRPSATSP